MAKLTGKLDLAKLTSGLEKYSKQVGETGRDATARWSVQLCRELARQTQAWGTDRAKSYEKQVNAIYKDFLNILIVVPYARPNNKRYLSSHTAILEWLELNRTRRRARTPSLQHSEKKLCTQTDFNKAVEVKVARAGLAKGGWLGAGIFIAGEQSGLDRIQISRGYIPWAYRNTHLGRGSMDKTPHHPTASLANNAKYTVSDYVLAQTNIDRAIMQAGMQTIKRYEKIIERLAK